jgi:hypothetical protein
MIVADFFCSSLSQYYNQDKAKTQINKLKNENCPIPLVCTSAVRQYQKSEGSTQTGSDR